MAWVTSSRTGRGTDRQIDIPRRLGYNAADRWDRRAGRAPNLAGTATTNDVTKGDFRMNYSRHAAGVPRSIWRHSLSLLPLVLGALTILVLLAGQAQPVFAQYPVLPTPTAAPAPPTQPPATATPVPAPPTATVPAPAPTKPAVAQPTAPGAQPTVAPPAPTKPAAQPTAGAPATAAPTVSPVAAKPPAAAGNPTAAPAAAVSAPQAAPVTTGAPPAAVPGEGPVQSALRTMLTGLGTLWLILGVVAFVLAVLGLGYLFKNRGSGN
jgi:hypothetical protein